MPRRAAVADSLFRLARLGMHLARGLWIVQTRYARLAPVEQDRALEGWSRQLLAILRVRVAADNAPAVIPDRCLLVSNHDGGRTGDQTDAAAYVGDMSFVASMWRIAREPGLEVELRFAAAIDARGRHRRELAAMARELIARELDRPLAYPAVPDTAPGTDAGLPDGSPSARRPTRSPYPAPADPA